MTGGTIGAQVVTDLIIGGWAAGCGPTAVLLFVLLEGSAPRCSFPRVPPSCSARGSCLPLQQSKPGTPWHARACLFWLNSLLIRACRPQERVGRRL